MGVEAEAAPARAEVARAEVTRAPAWVWAVLGLALAAGLYDLGAAAGNFRDAVARSRAFRLVDAGQAAQAAALLAPVVASHPDSFALRMELARAQNKAGQYVDSLRTLRPLDGRKLRRDEIGQLRWLVSRNEQALSASPGGFRKGEAPADVFHFR